MKCLVSWHLKKLTNNCWVYQKASVPFESNHRLLTMTCLFSSTAFLLLIFLRSQHFLMNHFLFLGSNRNRVCRLRFLYISKHGKSWSHHLVVSSLLLPFYSTRIPRKTDSIFRGSCSWQGWCHTRWLRIVTWPASFVFRSRLYCRLRLCSCRNQIIGKGSYDIWKILK